MKTPIVGTIGAVVRDHIRCHYRNQRQAAAAWGCSQTVVSQVVSGQRRPTTTMLRDMGFKHVEVWVPEETIVEGYRLPHDVDKASNNNPQQQ